MHLEYTYSLTIFALGFLAVLMFLQVLVADIVGIRDKHVPGSHIPSDHGDLLFRASRVVANTNEIIAVFILAVLICLLSGAPENATGYSAWTFVVARLLYAAFYYLNWQLARSTIFGVSLMAIAGLIVVGFSAWS